MDTEPERTSDGFLTHRGLIAFASAAAMTEAGLLMVLAPAARSLAPQVTALPPLAIFHDLRWLYGSHRPPLGFTLLLVAVVLGRSAMSALLTRLAWPAGLTPPRPLAAMRSSLALTVVACVLLSPVVSLTFGVAILPFSWPFLGTLPALLLIALPLSHGGVVGDWWRMFPPLAAMGWLFADFGVLSAAAAAAGRLPFALAVPVAGLAGLVNARAWYGMTAAVTSTEARAKVISISRKRLVRRIPAAPVAVTVAIAVVVAATRVAFLIGVSSAQAGEAQTSFPVIAGAGQTGQSAGPGPTSRERLRRPPVLEVAGFGSTCCRGTPLLAQMMPGTLVQQFSYRGLDASGDPLPYGPAASDMTLSALGDRIAAQVERLHAETGWRVDVVAESEGTLGVYAMLARHPGVPIGSVILLSPIVAPGRVSYQTGNGSGLVPGTELKAVVWFVGGLSPFGTSGAQTLISSVNEAGARFAAAAARHRPLRLLTLVPLADSLTLPVCRLPSSVLVVPGFHGELLGNPSSLEMVRGFLQHRPVRDTASIRAAGEILAAAGSAWRMPQTLEPSPPCEE